ncbi:hypothetical protein Tco_0992616 [Tanacetum coccineum]|uniref:Uncharacterized protein n=1 Tax=Tanacetum coccineum TaxID=301880 RepID=A0ABQ5F434_9ASTR
MILSKKKRIQTKDHNDSLIAQVNSKTVENADLKAQIQEKVFANVALKNELRKLKGNSVDTKFAKPSILGKPVLQPPRNQSVVRQPNAFKSERLKLSKPRFASHVDVNYGFVKKTRNSQEETVWFNDMDHNHYLEDARKKGNKKGNRNQNLVSLFNDRCVADNTKKINLQAPFLKEKKGVRFSALYLQKKRNLLVFDHSHQHSSNFPMLIQSLSGSTSTWSLNVYEMVKMTPGYISSGLVQNSVSPTTYVPPSKRDYEILFQPLFDEYFNPPPCAVSPDPVAVAAPRPVDPAGSPLSTTIDQDVPSASTSPHKSGNSFSKVIIKVLKIKFMEHLISTIDGIPNVIHTVETGLQCLGEQQLPVWNEDSHGGGLKYSLKQWLLKQDLMSLWMVEHMLWEKQSFARLGPVNEVSRIHFDHFIYIKSTMLNFVFINI